MIKRQLSETMKLQKRNNKMKNNYGKWLLWKNEVKQAVKDTKEY